MSWSDNITKAISSKDKPYESTQRPKYSGSYITLVLASYKDVEQSKFAKKFSLPDI